MTMSSGNVTKRKHGGLGRKGNVPVTKRRKKFSKHVWTALEDRELRVAVEKVNKTNTPIFWSKVAESLPGRVGRQCRDRWVNHLRPKVNKEVWTQDEDKLLFDAIKAHGTQWAEIARRKILPGRTDLSLKNRYYSCLRREERKGRAEKHAPLRVKVEEDLDVTTADESPSDADDDDDLSQHSDVIELSSILLGMQSSPVHNLAKLEDAHRGVNDENDVNDVNDENVTAHAATYGAEKQDKKRGAGGYQAFVSPSVSPTRSDTVFSYPAESRLNAPFANVLVEQVMKAFKQSKGEKKPTVEEKNVPKTYANGRTVSGAYPGTENTGRWSHVEHEKFIEGMMKFGKNNWTAIANVVKTRTVVQVRTHAQKFYKRLKKSGSAEIDLKDLVQQRTIKVAM